MMTAMVRVIPISIPGNANFCWRLAITVTLLFWLLASFPAAGRSRAVFGNSNISVNGFQTRGLNEEGAVEWELFGQQATVKGTMTELETFKIFLMQQADRQFELTSPYCRYNHNLAEVKSDAPVHLTSDGIAISGLGYDVFLDRKVVLIRSTVHIVLKGRKNSLRRALSVDEKKSEQAATKPSQPKQTENHPSPTRK
ncbi:MAG TPA: hypothetical protein PKY10_03205 [Lentisphaeria bacterium]|nr:hypothetical protein [Lentisphaeria bacterium]